MAIDDYFNTAVRSEDPVQQLRSVALHLSAQGYDRTAITNKFEEMRQQLRREDRQTDEDAVLDAMDCLVGWCSPQWKLLLIEGGRPDVTSSPPEEGIPV